jgi:hypothetical protein
MANVQRENIPTMVSVQNVNQARSLEVVSKIDVSSVQLALLNHLRDKHPVKTVNLVNSQTNLQIVIVNSALLANFNTLPKMQGVLIVEKENIVPPRVQLDVVHVNKASLWTHRLQTQWMIAKHVLLVGMGLCLDNVHNVPKVHIKTNKACPTAFSVLAPHHSHSQLQHKAQIVLMEAGWSPMSLISKTTVKIKANILPLVKFDQIWCCSVQDVAAKIIHAMVIGTDQSVMNVCMVLQVAMLESV